MVGEWEDYLALWRDNIAWLSNAHYLSDVGKRQTTRGWLEALGARVIVNPHGNATLATLQLHLARLDLGKPKDGGAVDVPVAKVAPEPLRHGGERPQWLRADYAAPAQPTEAEVAANGAFWSKLERETRTPEGVAERHGWTLAEATAYLADYAAMEAEAEALSDEQRWDYWLTHTLPRPFEWIVDYRSQATSGSTLSRSSTRILPLPRAWSPG